MNFMNKLYSTILNPKTDAVTLPKKAMCLSHLLERPINAIEAANSYGDLCLSSTISELTQKHDLKFKKTKENYTHKSGRKSNYTRYELMPESILPALILLGHYDKEAA